MALTLPERTLRPSSRYSPTISPAFTFDTAYSGADGHIDILSLDDEALASNQSRSSSPIRTLSSTRSPLSTRLFSSALQNTQPAAAALTRSRSILHSRAKSLAAWTSSLGTTTPDKPRTPTTNKVFGDLFSGESAPIRLGLPSPVKEKEESEFVMEYVPSFTSSSSDRRRSSIGDRRSSQTPQKQSWLARKLGSSVTALPAAVPEHDELLTLNINNELFPDGPADPFSPSAFNDLLLNATTLLERMQCAYREKTEYIASVQPEIDAQREEVEEAETRAQHLKMQLEDMGRRAQDHENAMKSLAAQLAEEKIKVQEAQEQSRTVRMINEERPEWRRKRSSAGSASDSGFESDLDRDADSVASGSTTPAWSPAPLDGLERRLQYSPAKLQREAHYRRVDLQGAGGQPVSVLQLQNENQHLRKQVEEMQVSLQSCIDVLDVLQR